MVIYSVTVRVKSEISGEWMTWMKEVHIPHMMKTGYFNNYSIFKILVPESESGFSVYKVNYELDTLEKYYEYAQNEAKKLQEEVIEKYRGKFTASREVIEKI
jgi:Domain of unknown function (DUF4286)